MGTAHAQVVTLDNGEKAVFKAKDREPVGQRRNIDGDLYKREAAASHVADILGLGHLVPPTTVREVNGKLGSIQQFVSEADVAIKRDDEMSWYDGKEDLARAAAYDYLIGNMDRHPKNWMLGYKDHSLHLIDHGLSFPNRQSESLVNWELIREAEYRKLGIPKEIKNWNTKMPQVAKVLAKDGLTPMEINGVRRRAKQLARLSNFSQIGHFPDKLFP